MSSSHKPRLRIDWCSYDAAKYAVQHWHYSRSMPSSKTARLGVWENRKFLGTTIFAWGANLRLGGEYGLSMTECAELCRVALTTHETPVSRIISIAAKMLKRAQPGLRLIVSYADPQQGHIGIVYQAGGWIYVGEAAGTAAVLLDGKITHRRTVNSKYPTSSIEWLRKHVDKNATAVPTLRKYKYLMPLDQGMREKLLPLKKPYPKRATSRAIAAPDHQSGEAGGVPSVALQAG